jgi:predicted phage tail component-like protein
MLEYLEDGYLGFTFDGRHSSEFNLLVVSDGSRYHQNLFSNFSDNMQSVPGRNGAYFFGTQLEMKEFEINCAFDKMTTHMRDEIQMWLYPDKVGWLIFDEEPYKKYLVKISGIPNFNFLPFNELKTIHNYNLQKEILKGELTIPFFSFNEYAYENSEYSLPKIDINEIIPQHAINSGIIPPEYKHPTIFLSGEKISSIEKNTEFSLYNAGNGIAKLNLIFYIPADQIENKYFELFNYEDGQKYIIQDLNPIFESKNIDKFKIEILSDKQEIYATGCRDDANNTPITDRINIGGSYNHYYPKLYHKKMTQIAILSEALGERGEPEPLFYTYSYNTKYFEPSDKENRSYSFEEIKDIWSNYTIITKEGEYSVNNIINPAFMYVHLNPDSLKGEYGTYSNEYLTPQNELIYLIYPNKYIANCDMYNFIPEYKNTYI